MKDKFVSLEPVQPPLDRVYYYNADHLKSSTYVTDDNGRPVTYYDYLPFGEVAVEHNQTTNFNNGYKFNAKELDEATGMSYYGARYYDSRLSVFVSVDPLAEEFRNFSPYIYTLNNPIRFIDPDGRKPEDWYFIFDKQNNMKVYDTGTGNNIYVYQIYTHPLDIIQRDVNYSQVVSYIGKQLNNNTEYKYEYVLSFKGGHYDPETGTVTITNNSFRYGNYYDVASSIEHELFHKKETVNGDNYKFKNHVDVYMKQASTDIFKKTSREYKSSHAVAIAQRILNAYVDGDYDNSSFVKKVNEYNLLNPENKISIIYGGSTEKTILKVKSKQIKFNPNLKPYE